MARLKYPQEYYRALANISGDPILSRKQQEAEYEKLRKRAARSLERISRSEFANDQFYREQYGQYDQPASQLTDRQLAYQLQEVARYVSSARSTYTGAREIQRAAVRTMKQHGYGFITYKNYQSFAEFMGEVKAAYGDRLYDSKRIVEFFDENKSNDVTATELFTDFENWIAKQSGKY